MNRILFLQHIIYKSMLFSLLFLNACAPSLLETDTPTSFSANIESPQPIAENFNGERAYLDVVRQVEMGPRTPKSDSHARVIEYITNELENSKWNYEIQKTQFMGHDIQNITAKQGTKGPIILIGAHYDSRMIADRDSDNNMRTKPVPGANDGASGVAVLLELARSLPKNIDKQIWLLFIDAEDQGEIPGWDWILGSKAYAENLLTKPDAVIIIDMIGDADLNIYKEKNSDENLTLSIWNTAQELGYHKQFINEYKYSILDDHIPFKELGIPAIDIIDFDYPYWHTTQDTADKVSAESLQIIGDTLTEWLIKQ